LSVEGLLQESASEIVFQNMKMLITWPVGHVTGQVVDVLFAVGGAAGSPSPSLAFSDGGGDVVLNAMHVLLGQCCLSLLMHI
jgi:hypothetical protein